MRYLILIALTLSPILHGAELEYPTLIKSYGETKEFKNFEQAFWQLCNSIESKTGIKFFTDAEYMGDGIVKITATDIWLSASYAERSGNLNTIFNMWEAAEGTGMPIAIYVYDSSGNMKMKKTKGR